MTEAHSAEAHETWWEKKPGVPMLPGAKHAQNRSQNRQQGTKKVAGAKTVKTQEALGEKKPGVSPLPHAKHKQNHLKDGQHEKT